MFYIVFLCRQIWLQNVGLEGSLSRVNPESFLKELNASFANQRGRDDAE
jgi:hypothetical protein